MNTKNVFLILCCIFCTTVFTEIKAQVTIGSGVEPNANALLDLKEQTDGTSQKGFLLPRVTLTASDDASPMSGHIKGMVVYNTATANDVVPGFYYNDGTQWIKLGASVSTTYVEPWMISGTTNPATSNTDNIYQIGHVGIGTKNPQAVFHIDGAKDNAETPTAAQLANDFIVTPSGSVGIGTVTPDASAILDITATNKGLLGPRVALNSITDETTIPSPADGLLVYNTGAGALDFVGYVFWNGSEWRALNNGSLAPGTIGAITCNGVTLTPSIYKAGEYFEGTMIVPYTGGNGGVYAAQTLGPINGLTATLAAGNFAAGAGNLAYTITGTPTVTTPDVTVFNIVIGGQTCSATIGAGDGIAPGDLVFYSTPEIPANIGGGDNNSGNTSTNWMSYYVNDLPVIGGKLRLDAYFSSSSTGGAGTVSINPRLVNITDNNVKVWFSAMTTVDRFNGSNIVLQPNTWLNLDNGLYYSPQPNQTMTSPATGAYVNTSSNNSEVLTLDLQLDSKWYRIYYYPIVDNKDQTTAANMVRKIYLSIQRLY